MWHGLLHPCLLDFISCYTMSIIMYCILLSQYIVSLFLICHYHVIMICWLILSYIIAVYHITTCYHCMLYHVIIVVVVRGLEHDLDLYAPSRASESQCTASRIKLECGPKRGRYSILADWYVAGNCNVIVVLYYIILWWYIVLCYPNVLYNCL